LINLGNLSQMTMVVGYIPHELTLVTNEQGNYQMKFNIRTFDDENISRLLPCIAFEKMAKNLYDEFEEKDTIVIWGQLIHTYSAKFRDSIMTIKVISYSIVVDLGEFLFEPSLSQEKKAFLKEMSDLFDNQAPAPTEDEILFWREHWKEWKKVKYDEKIAKQKKQKEQK
jgi:hypothetical protein